MTSIEENTNSKCSAYETLKEWAIETGLRGPIDKVPVGIYMPEETYMEDDDSLNRQACEWVIKNELFKVFDNPFIRPRVESHGEIKEELIEKWRNHFGLREEEGLLAYYGEDDFFISRQALVLFGYSMMKYGHDQNSIFVVDKEILNDKNFNQILNSRVKESVEKGLDIFEYNDLEMTAKLKFSMSLTRFRMTYMSRLVK